MDFDVFVYRDASGAFIARVPALAGCHSWGRTREEALGNVRDAIRLAVDEKEAEFHAELDALYGDEASFEPLA